MLASSRAKTVSARKNLFWILLSLIPILLVGLYTPAVRFLRCERFQGAGGFRGDVIIDFPGESIRAEVADNVAEREQGLSGRPCMRSNQAMLFVFDESDVSDHCFWMKDMRFPIDILWLDKDKRVVFSASNVSPDSYPTKYCPAMPTRYVLELPGGKAADLGLGYDQVIPL